MNIIGEHTDYNDGLVLPMTTGLFTSVRASPRGDRFVSVTSMNRGSTEVFGLDHLEPRDDVDWIDYVRGVAAELQAEGIEVSAADLVIESDIPEGAGLSSSAALELAVALAFLGSAGASLDPARLATICQRAEQRFAGVRCGIMDQYTVACARPGHALLLDCASLAFRQIAVPGSFAFIVTDSGVRHRLPDGDYNNRASECAAALAILQREVPELRSLCDVDRPLLERHANALGRTLRRRVRHVITENARVGHAVTALEAASAEELGSLLSQSHVSLRDDFEVSCEEIDALVAITRAVPGVLGSRMIGGGFGGCVLSLVRHRHVERASGEIRQRFRSAFGYTPWMHVACPADPAQEIDP